VNLKQALRAFSAVVLEEADRNPLFAERLQRALNLPGEQFAAEATVRTSADKRQRARAAAILDPVAIFAERGEEALRQALQPLLLGQLLDIVAEFAMDPSKLVMKWKNAERVVEHIVASARRRSIKGDAFRA
jgi:hypothetical protein